MKLLEVVFVILLLFIIYLLVDNNTVWLTKHILTFDELPEEFNGLRIIQLADLHKKTFGKNNKNLIKAVKKQSPDYILLCGDMVNRDCTDFTNIENLLNKLSEICPVYYSLGNHEIDMPANMKSKLFATAKSAGVTLLDNGVYTITKDKNAIQIAGISLFRENYRRKDTGYKNLRTYELSDLESAIGLKKVYNFTCIILFAKSYSRWGADLILSVCACGIIRCHSSVDCFPERKFFQSIQRNIHCFIILYVSIKRSGKLRIFNPPEIVLIELNKS